MGIILFPFSGYPDYFLFRFQEYLCVLHFHFNSLLFLISCNQLNNLGILLLPFQGVLITFWFIFSNISVYYILILYKFVLSSLFIDINLIYTIQIFSGYIIQVLIHTTIHKNWICVIRKFHYYPTYLHNRWVYDPGECFFPLHNTGQRNIVFQ